MDEFIKLQEQYDNANFHQSSSVGNYTLNDIQNQTKSMLSLLR